MLVQRATSRQLVQPYRTAGDNHRPAGGRRSRGRGRQGLSSRRTRRATPRRPRRVPRPPSDCSSKPRAFLQEPILLPTGSTLTWEAGQAAFRTRLVTQRPTPRSGRVLATGSDHSRADRERQPPVGRDSRRRCLHALARAGRPSRNLERSYSPSTSRRWHASQISGLLVVDGVLHEHLIGDAQFVEDGLGFEECVLREVAREQKVGAVERVPLPAGFGRGNDRGL